MSVWQPRDDNWLLLFVGLVGGGGVRNSAADVGQILFEPVHSVDKMVYGCTYVR